MKDILCIVFGLYIFGGILYLILRGGDYIRPDDSEKYKIVYTITTILLWIFIIPWRVHLEKKK